MPHPVSGSGGEPFVSALAWRGDALDGVLVVLDQTRLPGEETYRERRRAQEVRDDIRRLAVRGAPALGVAGAYALVLAAREALEEREGGAGDSFAARFASEAERIAGARPTAVNLRGAVERSLARWRAAGLPSGKAPALLLEAARELEAAEEAASAAIGRHGADRLGGATRLLTHCNTGALVSPGRGTALAAVYELHGRGRTIHVWVDETRPLLQGLRLTAWELGRAGIPHAVLADGAAAALFRRGLVDAVIVGADRVCRNGDVVNKVGTYGLAVLGRHHGVPFLVAAPVSTLDAGTARGDDVEIEERPGDLGRYLAPGLLPAPGASHEPAFDVTPAALVTCLVTDRGPVERPDEERLRPFLQAAADLQAGRAPGR